MSKRFSKKDITVHSSQEYTGPAINVKVYQFPHDRFPGHEAVTCSFLCTQGVADKALEYAYNTAQETFWADVQNVVQEIFGADAKAYSMGRSGGWLYVTGIPDVDAFDAKLVAKWGRLVHAVNEMIKQLTSWDFAREEVAEYIEREKQNTREEQVRDAAPLMLEALKGLLANAPKPKRIRDDFSYTLYLEAARTAIAKAEGKVTA